jgi:hypothetical protein
VIANDLQPTSLASISRPIELLAKVPEAFATLSLLAASMSRGLTPLAVVLVPVGVVVVLSKHVSD